MSPLTLAKSKRWLPAIESSRGSPDRCEERECVQTRRRAATKRRITQHTGIVFSVQVFSVPLIPRRSVRVTLRDSSAGPFGSPLFVSKTTAGSYGVGCTACNAATTSPATFFTPLLPYRPVYLLANLPNCLLIFLCTYPMLAIRPTMRSTATLKSSRVLFLLAYRCACE